MAHHRVDDNIHELAADIGGGVEPVGDPLRLVVPPLRGEIVIKRPSAKHHQRSPRASVGAQVEGEEGGGDTVEHVL